MGLIILLMSIIPGVISGVIFGLIARDMEFDESKKGKAFSKVFFATTLVVSVCVFLYVCFVQLKDWNG
jgi:hypothetical protein